MPDPSIVRPDHFALIPRPGNDLIQLALSRDYINNLTLYPRLHEYLRTSRVPLLAVWGRNDEIFSPAGARAFQDDLPGGEIHLLDGGHFLLESDLETVAWHMHTFLGKGARTHRSVMTAHRLSASIRASRPDIGALLDDGDPRAQARIV